MSILQQRALGLLETRGLIAAIEASDAMCKAATVNLLHVQRIGAARVCVLVAGELGACEAALDAGARAAYMLGDITGQRIIARPADDVDALLVEFCPNAGPVSATASPATEDQVPLPMRKKTAPQHTSTPRSRKDKAKP